MSDKHPVEVTTRFVTNVPDLTSAFSFVMEKIDVVGPDPSIEISPVWVKELGSSAPEAEGWGREFSVVVSGMVEEERG